MAVSAMRAFSFRLRRVLAATFAELARAAADAFGNVSEAERRNYFRSSGYGRCMCKMFEEIQIVMFPFFRADIPHQVPGQEASDTP